MRWELPRGLRRAPSRAWLLLSLLFMMLELVLPRPRESGSCQGRGICSVHSAAQLTGPGLWPRLGRWRRGAPGLVSRRRGVLQYTRCRTLQCTQPVSCSNPRVHCSNPTNLHSGLTREEKRTACSWTLALILRTSAHCTSPPGLFAQGGRACASSHDAH